MLETSIKQHRGKKISKEERETIVIVFLSMLETDTDRQLFTELYNQYGNAMLRVSRRFFLDDPTMVEDAVQNAWLRIAENFSRIQEIPCKKRGGYLVVIAKNESISLLRKRRQEVQFDDTKTVGESGFENGSAEDVIETIRAMPETYRAVLEMRFVEEMSTKEIAALLGLKESAVDVRIHRGRALLMKKLREEGIAP